MERKFKKFFKVLQKNYWKIYQVDNLFNCTSHKRMQCLETRDFLIKLFIDFGMDKKFSGASQKLLGTNYQQKHSSISKEQFNKYSEDKVKIKIVELDGSMYPSHTFLIIKIGKTQFLLQSFYYAYLLSGKYGLREMDEDDSKNLEKILDTYNFQQNKQLNVKGEWKLQNEKVVANNNLQYYEYTGIDDTFSMIYNYQWELGGRKVESKKNTYSEYYLETSLENFIYRLKYKFLNMFDLFEDALYENAKLNIWDYDLEQREKALKGLTYGFDFQYEIYNAFIDGSLCNSSNSYKNSIKLNEFQKLTGINKNLVSDLECKDEIIRINKYVKLDYTSVKKSIKDIVDSIPEVKESYESSYTNSSSSLSTSFGK